MPTKPGKTYAGLKRDTHRPNRTQLYYRQKQKKCLEGIAPGQEFKCDPRYQPPAPKFQQGSIFGEFEVVKTRYGFSWKRRKA